MRIDANHWEMLNWVAAANGTMRADEIRQAIADRVKGAKPPQTPTSLVIQASEECRAAFAAAGRTYNPPMTAEQLAFQLLLNQCTKRLGGAPEFRGGQWHWMDPTSGENA